MKYMDFERKYKEYQNQTGDIRRGIGMSVFWYNTAVWPISLETSSCRMVMNQDGSVQVQVGETEIGQGADTAFAQMAADTLGVPFERYVVSCQDTDVTPTAPELMLHARLILQVWQSAPVQRISRLIF